MLNKFIFLPVNVYRADLFRTLNFTIKSNAKNTLHNNSYTAVRVHKRYKYKDARSEETELEEFEVDDIDQLKERGSKIIDSTVKSLRVDLVLKTGLGISRNKIETAFYENKIRRNGESVTKKSDTVYIDDELDLISEKIPKNSNMMYVSRIKLLAAKLENDSYRIKLARDKNLLVEK